MRLVRPVRLVRPLRLQQPDQLEPPGRPGRPAGPEQPGTLERRGRLEALEPPEGLERLVELVRLERLERLVHREKRASKVSGLRIDERAVGSVSASRESIWGMSTRLTAWAVIVVMTPLFAASSRAADDTPLLKDLTREIR